MIIKRLKLHNFGAYVSDHEFYFSGEKPIVLIGGNNGRGKTTILEAVLLALYGSNSYAYKESKYKSYGRYLKSFVNRDTDVDETFVELEFEYLTEHLDIYSICRRWKGNNIRTKEVIEVKENGKLNEFLTQNWAMFIENILPSGLSNFFIFDGEKIAPIAEDSTSNELKAAIKSMLGITVLDQLEKDVKRVISNASKENTSKERVSEFNKLQTKKDALQEELRAYDDQIIKTEGRGLAIEKALEHAHQNYRVAGGDVIEQKQELFKKKTELNILKSQNTSELLEMSSSSLPLFMVKNLLTGAYEKAKKEEEHQKMDATIKLVDSMYETYLNEYSTSDAVEHFIEYLKHKSETEVIDSIYHLSSQALHKLDALCSSDLSNLEEKTRRMIARSKEIGESLEEIDDYLSVEINEEAVASIYKTIKELEKDKIDNEVELNSLKEKRNKLNVRYTKENVEFKRFAENLLRELELIDDADRIVKYAHYVLSVIDSYRIRLQTKKTKHLADTMTICYKKLANKLNMIKTIKIDPITLELSYCNHEGNMIDRNTLSAGEKQLMVISLLWALAICSKKKLPVIIDTPLARLDSEHRVSLIKSYFPYASEQTIILSTDSEIDHTYYEMLKEYISDEYLLVFDDETQSTTIHKGYFKEALT